MNIELKILHHLTLRSNFLLTQQKVDPILVIRIQLIGFVFKWRMSLHLKTGYWKLIHRKLIRLVYTIRSEEHTSELQSRGHLVCRLLLEKKKKKKAFRCLSSRFVIFFFLLLPRPPFSSLFPYTTLFRSIFFLHSKR